MTVDARLHEIGRNARTRTVNGARWLPYMPIGDNSNFLVDASHFN